MGSGDRTYREAMRDLIGERWGVLWRKLPAAHDPDDLEAVHDIRVASRRLRAAMDVAVDAFPSSWYKPLHRVAKDVTSTLGEVRDRDVLIQSLSEELAQVPPHEQPGIAALIERVERERTDARAAMTIYLHGLAASGAPEETVRRFGKLADPSDLAAAATKERS